MELCWAYNLQFDFIYQWDNFVLQYYAVSITIALKYSFEIWEGETCISSWIIENYFSYSWIPLCPYDVYNFSNFSEELVTLGF